MSEGNRSRPASATNESSASFRGRSGFLLISLLALILLYPVVRVGPLATYLVLGLNCLVLVTAVNAVADSRRHIWTAAVLATIYAVLATVGVFLPRAHPIWKPVIGLESVVMTVFYVYAIKQILIHILHGKRVNKDTLYGGLAVYLMLGLAWASVFATVELIWPDSFQFVADPQSRGGLRLVYFSFVTLTTLGYGDITPLTDSARSLVILETITGQLYLAVMVARLVSLYRPSEPSKLDS